MKLSARQEFATSLNDIRDAVLEANTNAGWLTDLETGASLRGKRDFGGLIALAHSELSEALEGHRKNLPDDKLPHRPMAEVELADAIIRIMDIAGDRGFDIGGALVEKMAYNATRADHKPENRRKEGGKKF